MATAPAPQPALPFIHPDDMPDVYALKGIGNCLEPDLPDGSLLVFNKRIEPEPGDHVGIIFTQEAAHRYGMPGWVKRLLIPPPGFPGLIVVEQINPPRSYSIPSHHVLAIHRCIGTAQPGGEGKALVRRNLIEGER